MGKSYLTVKEAAQRLRVHDRTVRRYIREKRLTGYTIPTPRSHLVRLDEDEVNRMVRGETPVVTGAGG